MARTIDEAIKANEDTVELLTEKGLVIKAEAVQLGIEALKRVRAARDTPAGLSFAPLPGEKEE